MPIAAVAATLNLAAFVYETRSSLLPSIALVTLSAFLPIVLAAQQVAAPAAATTRPAADQALRRQSGPAGHLRLGVFPQGGLTYATGSTTL